MAAVSAQSLTTKSLLLSQAYRNRLIAILLFANTLNFVDRAVLAVAIEPMRRELGLGDAQIGLLQGVAFGLVYALTALPVGYLADRYSRKLILTCSTVIFSLMSGVCGFCSNFGQLFIARSAVGAGEAAFGPTALSLLADHFPSARRASSIALVNLGSPFGSLLGSAGGGMIIAYWGWRSLFFATVVPGLVAAALILFCLREPGRGLVDGSEKVPHAKLALSDILSRLIRIRSLCHMIAGAALTLVATYAVAQFTFSFYIRVHGLTPQSAGLAAGIVSFAAIAVGMLVGGFGLDRLRRIDIRWAGWMPAMGVTVAALAHLVAFMANGLWLSIGGFLIGGAALFCFYAPVYSTVQTLAPPQMRGTALGALAMLGGIIGAGLGPTLAGLLSDHFAHAQLSDKFFRACTHAMLKFPDPACTTASAIGLQYALATMCSFFIWAAAHFWLASRHLRTDLAHLDSETG